VLLHLSPSVILPFDRDNNLTYINIGRGVLGDINNIINKRAKYMI